VNLAVQSGAALHLPVQPRPARLSALGSFENEAGWYLVVGYESGDVAVLRAHPETVIGSSEMSSPDAPPLHAGPVLAIAIRPPGLGGAVDFATAAADGTVAIYRSPTASTPVVEAQPVVFEAGQGDTQPASVGPIPRRDGLMLDSSGRVLLLWDQTGGVSVARLDARGLPVFRRYPLPGIEQSTPARSEVAVQSALRDIGLYDGQLDGIMGPMTQSAISAFQARTGLGTIAPNDTGRLETLLLPTTWSTSAVALSPRGDLFAIAGLDGKVQLVQLPSDPAAAPSSARTIDLLGHHTMVVRIAISPDGRIMASLDATGRLLLTDLDRLLSISSVPLAAFRTVSSPADLDPLPVDLGVFLVATGEPAGTDAQAPDFLIVVDADRTIEGANAKASSLRSDGFENVSVLLRNGWYRTVVGFTNAGNRDAALAGIRTLKADAYPTFMPSWCPMRTDRASIRTCGPSASRQTK
jgi:peptidoglycan hydrolase-like protein with peptidoglycan-binding domain